MEIRAAVDDDTEAILRLLREADDARVLTLESLRHVRRTRPARARGLELVAEDEGDVVGCGTASLNIETSAVGAAWASVTVDSRRRREGIGTALGERLMAHLHVLEARKVTTFIRRAGENERWAVARGWTPVITAPLIAVDPRRIAAPAALADGLRCLPLSELTADDLFPAVCEAALDEPSAVPTDRFVLEEFRREWDDPAFDLECGAAVLAGDEVVAFAFMKVAGDRAQHGFTGTLRAYRGRGLATTAKRFALNAAARHGVTRVTTSNAEQNAAMRAINRRLGFEQIGEHAILAREL